MDFEMPPVFGAGRWRGRWIWAAGTDERTASARAVVALRREFAVDDVAPSVPARLMAVAGYALFVNGTEMARGPMRGTRRRRPYDLLDLAPALVPGVNTVAALVWCYRQAMPWWLPPTGVSGGLDLGGFVFEAWLGDEGGLVVSDASWVGIGLGGWTMTPPVGVAGRGREVIDLAELPADWTAAQTKRENWPAAIERQPKVPGGPVRPEPPSHPLGPTEPRAVSWPRPDAVALRRNDDGWVAEQVVAGSVRVEVEGPPGAVVTCEVAERLDGAGRPAPGPHDAAFDVVCDGSRREIETLDRYGLSGVATRGADGASVHRIEVVERLHPVIGEASFRCSDPRLDRIWEVGRRTVSACSWDAYVDCPTREQRAWTGDAVVHQMVDLATNLDLTLARWHPRLAVSPLPDGMLPMAVAGDIEHASTTIIPDWALHWVHSVWNLYRYVGDAAEVAAFLPAVDGVVQWFQRFCGADGLPVDVMGSPLIDWASVYTDGISSSLCGLWGRALLEYEEMAIWVDDGGRADAAAATHTRLVAGFERLWDPDRGLYVDVIRDGQRLPMASQHAQAAAIAGRLVPPERLARLVEVLTDEEHLVHAAFSAPDGPAAPNSEVKIGGAFLVSPTGPPAPWWDVETQVVRAQPFFRYVVHDALVLAGRADLIADACLDWEVLLERCPTSWSETWYGGTTCHGWSATPTRDLTTYVLGVQPRDPGFRVARIEPALGTLTWAAGAVPTPLGMLHIDVRPDRLEVDSPIPFAHRGVERPAGRHTITAGLGSRGHARRSRGQIPPA